jgi:alpha-glucosidase
VLGNHDNSRIASRIGSAQARVAAMLLLTLRGTPTLYYGDEIGMQNVPIPPERVKDPFEKNVPGLGLGRDPARTPMQWSAASSAGFTTGAPWLPIADDYTSRNVEAQSADPKSILTLHGRLIQIRREQAALSIGTYQSIPAQGDLLAYRRSIERGRRYLVVLNLSSEPATFGSAAATHHGRVALSTNLDREAEAFDGQIELRGDEGLLIELTDS